MATAKHCERTITGLRQAVPQGESPQHKWRLWSSIGTINAKPWTLLSFLVALLLASASAIEAQTFQAAQPLFFTMPYQGANPLPQVLTVASTGLPFNFSSSVVNGTGGNWLTVSPGGCCYSTPTAITVSAAPATPLAAGTYNANLSFKSQDATKTLIVPVTLIVEPASGAAPYFDSPAGALTFSLSTNGGTPPLQQVSIRNAIAGTLNWTASASTADGANWLTLSSTAGTAPSLLNVGIDLSKLPNSGVIAGTFTGQITLLTTSDTVTIPVTVTVGDSVFRQINPLGFAKTALSTDNPPPQVITVSSTYGTFKFSAVALSGTGGDWLSLSPSGCCYGTSTAITVAAKPISTLKAGTYTAEIVLKSQDGSQVLVVPITLSIEDPTTPAYLDALPGGLAFSLATYGNATPPQALQIRNAGKTGTLTWTASANTADGGDWLTLSATTGVAPSILNVGVDPSKLPYKAQLAGTYTGQVVLQTTGQSVTVPITVTVGDSVFLQINPLSFSKTALSTDNPPSQVITVASTYASFNFSAVAVSGTGGDWLTISPSGCCYATPTAITVAVAPPAALKAGTYTAEIVLKSQDGSQTIVVPVTLAVKDANTPAFFDALPGGLTFSLANYGNATPLQALQIRNAGKTGTLAWTASASTADGGSWLTLSSSGGTAPSILNVGVDPTKLPGEAQLAGTFTGQVVLQTGVDSVTVPVSVTVGASVFRQINPLSFTKTALSTDNPLPQVLTVAGTQAFNFTATAVNGTGGSWLTVSPSGCCYGIPTVVTVTANPPAALAAGTYTAEIVLKSQDGSQAVVVPVTLAVEPAKTATFFDSIAGAATFSVSLGGSAPAPQGLRIRNAGVGTLNWTASASTADGGKWLTLSSTSGTAPSVVNIAVDPSQLPDQSLVAGTFTGQVLLQTTGDSITVPVTVTVGNSLFLPVAQLDFAKATGGINPPTQTITIAGTLPFNFSDVAVNGTGGAWLAISPSGCCYATSTVIKVMATPMIAQGTATAEIIVRSQDGTQPLVIPVTLSVGTTPPPPPAVATPTFTPAGGTYTSAQSVTLTDSTPGAIIYYTTNGNTPTTSSTVYTGPIAVTSTETLQAIAVASGYTNSAVASAAYTITSSPPPSTKAPSFLSMAYVTTGASANGVSLQAVAADFNGDGIQDLATTNNIDSTVSILLGKGTGAFQTPVAYAVGNGPYGLVAGDFNGDGKPDLAVVNGLDNTVSILLNNGGAFPAKPSFTYTVGDQPYGVSMADFNRDGFLDLVVTNNASKTLSVLLGKGDGSFQAATSYATGNYPFGTAIADVNKDGYPDMIVWNLGDNTVGVLLNNKAGGFAPAVTYATGADPYGVTAGDFNGDGYPDLAVANLGGNTVSILLNNKTGGFAPAVTYKTGLLPASVLAQDLNGDGVLDLSAANLGDGTVSILLGKGDGTFLTQMVYPANTQPYSLLSADFNGDGLPDLAVTSFFENTVGVLLQTTSTNGKAKGLPPKKLLPVPVF